MCTPEEEQLIYDAWLESETYQVAMTEEGERLAQHRWYAFQKGWKYALFYVKHGGAFTPDKMENINRIEVVDEEGQSYTKNLKSDNRVFYSLQDNDKTLKISIRSDLPEE